MEKKIEKVIQKLTWMESKKIWPNGKRYLWTDAYGLMLYVSLFRHFNDKIYLDKSELLVKNVKSILGRKKGFRIGEDPERDGQYFHYLTKWMYALNELGRLIPKYHHEAVQLAKDVHPHFFVPNIGMIWKMEEDLSKPYRGYGFGGLDSYDAFVTYRVLDPEILKREISDVWTIVSQDYPKFSCSQDLGLGETLWMAHHFPNEDWAKKIIQVSLRELERMWRPKGYFIRDSKWDPNTILAFGNHGVSIGIQSICVWEDKVERLQKFFEEFKSGDKYDEEAITWVMYCNSLFPGVLIK